MSDAGGHYTKKFGLTSSKILTDARAERVVALDYIVRSDCASGALADSRGQNPKIFLPFFRFSAGGVGGADKKWKGNFWFCFAASYYEESSLSMTLLFALFYIFAATRGAYNSVCAKAQSNLIVLDPPAQCAHKSPPF